MNASEALPCSVASQTLKDYDHWAFGHIHARRVLSERPWIVLPGNIHGRLSKESSAKGWTLVIVEDGAISVVEYRAVCCAGRRWMSTRTGLMRCRSPGGRIEISLRTAVEADERR